MQIDTKDILFICGGAFIDLEKTISERYMFMFQFQLHLVQGLVYDCYYFQTTRLFHWVWGTSSCKHENRRRYNCCSDVIFVGNRKLTPVLCICQPLSSLLYSYIPFNSYVLVGKIVDICFCQVESSDLIAYGLIPEFVGRFPILVNLLALTENQLVQVEFIRKSGLNHVLNLA